MKLPALSWRCTLKEFNGESDPVHLIISFPPDVQVSTKRGQSKNSIQPTYPLLNLPTGYFGFTANQFSGQVIKESC